MHITPIIILDGPDNVGKGTQLALLRKYFKSTPFVITNLDKPVGNNLDEKKIYGLQAITHQLTTMALAAKQGIPCIADRGHYTEYAYSMFREAHTLETILAIEQQYQEVQDIIIGIIFVDDVENISGRDDGQSAYNKEDLIQIQHIIERFEEHAAVSHFETKIINIKEKDIETVHQEVIRLLQNKFPSLQKKAA